MEYGKFTQGTILHGIRSERFPDVSCSGVIITARCDIAQCKTTKFYYLLAMDVQSWITTEGLLLAADRKLVKELNGLIEKYKETIPGLSDYQNAASTHVGKLIESISQLQQNTEKRDKVINQLELIKCFSTEDNDPAMQLKQLDKLKPQAIQQLETIIDGKNTQYCYIPQHAYLRSVKEPYDGLVVNLQNINYLTSDVVGRIERQELDYDKLSPEDLEMFGRTFFLQESGDMIFPEEKIKSPYLEYLMQAFSFSFIRIGVDVDRNAVKGHWREIMNK